MVYAETYQRLRSTPKKQPYTTLYNPIQFYTTLHHPIQPYTTHNMKAKMLTPIASVQGKIAKGYYARILNGQQIIQRCPVRTKPPTTAQRRAQRDFVLRYAPHPKQPP